jgi:hypothetical protein
MHKRVAWRPNSDRPGFEPIAISVDEGKASFEVIAEMPMVLGRDAD